MTVHAPEGPPGTEGLWPLGRTLVLPLLLVPPLVATAGLAPLVVTALTALVVGVPTVVVLRRRVVEPPSQPVLDQLAVTLRDLTVGAVLAGAAAAVLAPLPVGANVAVASAGWGLAGVLSSRDRRAGWALATLAGMFGIGAGVVMLAGGPFPVTALKPHWSELSGTLAPSLVAGLTLGGLGLGQWAGPRRPGSRLAPWATTGIGLLATVAATLSLAVAYERDLQWPAVDGVMSLVAGFALVAAATRWLAQAAHPARLGMAGFIASAWFVGPAAGILGLLATGVLPLAIAGTTALAARRTEGADRVMAAVATLTALGAAALTWRGANLGTLGDALALGASLVVGFWIVATALARRQAEVSA